MLRLGDIAIDMPAVQAALSGYSDLPMRRVARGLGAEFCFNEVVLDKTVLTKGKGRRRALFVAADDHPLGGQLMGAVSETFGEAANHMVEAGYDLVDVNFGCPVNKALGRCRGGFHLGQPTVALDIVRRVVDACAGRVPVTVKMRRGLDESAASERHFFEILDGAFGLGIAAVTVHGRTVQQKYVGASDWRFLARVKAHLGEHTMLGSGDLFRADDVKAMMETTGVNGVTLARGCIGNPWIFQQTRELLAGRRPVQPTVGQQREAIASHWRHAVEVYGEDLAVRRTRTHAIKYARLHPEPVRVRDAFVAVKRPLELQAVLNDWYAVGADSGDRVQASR
ncbi:MAG: tRNA dihydrouridine synthase [Planctomycetota bacterium]|jgi:nifR3 family TIM-barrel protein